MENKGKKYSRTEVAEEIAKSLYKSIFNSIKSNKKQVEDIVEDLEDKNMIAEVDPDEIPSGKKVNIVNKSLKSHDDLKKGIDKLKQFICSRKQ